MDSNSDHYNIVHEKLKHDKSELEKMNQILNLKVETLENEIENLQKQFERIKTDTGVHPKGRTNSILENNSHILDQRDKPIYDNTTHIRSIKIYNEYTSKNESNFKDSNGSNKIVITDTFDKLNEDLNNFDKTNKN